LNLEEHATIGFYKTIANYGRAWKAQWFSEKEFCGLHENVIDIF
jgi:hypothetical protein